MHRLDGQPCCTGCTCGQPMAAPAMTIVEQPASTIVTEGWQMTGLASGRDQLGHARRDVPILRPIDEGVEWSAQELHLGIRVIELCVDAEDIDDAYIKVRGSDPKAVYRTWQSAAALAANTYWFVATDALPSPPSEAEPW